MSVDKNKLWQAYLDGELSVTETTNFEDSLTDEERDCLAAEMRFENGLAERLSQNAECPDAVWARTEALVRDAAAAKGGRANPRALKPNRLATYRRWYWGVGTFAAAAVLALVFSIVAPIPNSPSSPVVMAASSVEELAGMSDVQGNRNVAEEFLRQRNIQLGLNDESSLAMSAIHHDIHILGAHESSINGESVTEIFFGCCDYPVKILLAKRGSKAAKEIGAAAAGGGDVQATRVIDDYVTAVVGKHPAHDLLDIFPHAH